MQLPSLTFRDHFAWFCKVVFFDTHFLSLIFASAVNWNFFILLIIYTFVLVLYSYYWKKWWPIKNFGIAITYSSVIAFPYLSGIVNEPFYLIFLVSFLFILSREIRMDMKDILGDRFNGLDTIASRVGNRNANFICGILLLISVSLFIHVTQDKLNFIVQILLISAYTVIVISSFMGILKSKKYLFIVAEIEK